MAGGGNFLYVCRFCGVEFLGLASAERVYCSRACAASCFTGHRTHGESRTRLYQIWLDMRGRCQRKSDPGFLYYGGRGISVCEAWNGSYELFRDWARANGYADGLQIDRRDVNGNYDPSNCRWATRVQQMRNTRKRRNSKTSRFKGVSRHSQNGNWVVQLHANGKPINCGSYDTELEAAFAYDDAASDLYGEFARVNFPERIRWRLANANPRKECALR